MGNVGQKLAPLFFRPFLRFPAFLQLLLHADKIARKAGKFLWAAIGFQLAVLAPGHPEGS